MRHGGECGTGFCLGKPSTAASTISAPANKPPSITLAGNNALLKLKQTLSADGISATLQSIN